MIVNVVFKCGHRGTVEGGKIPLGKTEKWAQEWLINNAATRLCGECSKVEAMEYETRIDAACSPIQLLRVVQHTVEKIPNIHNSEKD